MFKKKRIFVSGGAGVIGQELVKKLVSEGSIVMVGDLVEIPLRFPKEVIYRRGDLNYITQQELDNFDPEIFFHLAATFERSTETYEHWEENFWHNIRLSNHLMTLIRNVPSIQRVIYASSYLIYDKSLYTFDLPQSFPVKLKETDHISPRNLTGLAKLAHEIELEFLSHFKKDKFTSICARIYRGYGKNSRDVISRWIRDLLNGEKISLYSSEGFFDYIYSEDTAEGLIRLAKIKESGIVNLGTGKSRKVSEVVSVLKQHFPKMEIELNESDIKYEASEADTTKLEKLINWIPQHSIEKGIEKIIEFEKERKIFKTLYYNVLVTSISKKIPFLKAVRNGVNKLSSNIKIFGGDIDCNCIGKYFVDEFWLMPRIAELDVKKIVNFCIEKNIRLIIPSRDGELEFFSKIKEELSQHGIIVMVSKPESINYCIDKLKFADLKEINPIATVENINDLDADSFVVKERYGAGSISIGVNLAKEEAINWSKKLEYPIYQPYIEGDEISVDAYISKNGNVKGIIMRKRVYIVGGESQVTTTFYNDILERKFEKIIGSLDLFGHVILQAFIDKNNEIHIIECNPRFGGASTIAVHSGLDSFYWLYLESLGYSLNDYPFINQRKEITQVRHPFDIYL